MQKEKCIVGQLDIIIRLDIRKLLEQEIIRNGINILILNACFTGI